MNRWRTIGFLLMVGSVMMGCGTMKVYEGPELPPDSVAMIREKFNWSPFAAIVGIVTVDGKARSKMDLYFSVKPGEHTVHAELHVCSGGYSYSPALGMTGNPMTCDLLAKQNLVFQTEAGQTYIVHGDRSTRTLWVMYEESGEVVAGEKPE